MRKRLIALVLLLQLKIASAYVDPGTGGMIITSSWAAIIAFLGVIGAFFVRVFFTPIKKLFLELRKKKLIKFILLILLIIVVSYLIFIGKGESKINLENMKYKKVLLIGIDGMDPEVIDRLMSEEKLPNFEKFTEKGTFINLSTSYPPQSPVAWTSISTGSNPGKHNIFDFIIRDPKTYTPKLALSQTEDSLGTKHTSNIKANTFWKITTNSDIPTTIIRWPNTFPPEKITGKMLSGEGVPDIKGFMSGYSFYTENKSIEQSKEAHKVVHVKKNNNIIETELSGPKTKKAGEIVDIKIPMKIKILENLIILDINNKEYEIETNKWSDFIKVSFKIGLLKEVNAIFKVYVSNTGPFEMFLTTLQVSPEDPIIDISYPEKYSKELTESIGTYYTLGMPEETDAYVDGRLSEQAFLEQVNEIEEQRDKMFWKEFDEFKKQETGVYAFVYDSSDRLQHLFWDEKVLKESKKRNQEIEINQVIENYYIEKDKFIGEVLNKIDNETLLIIISDHGFTSFEKSFSMNTWLVENGFMELTKELDETHLFQYVDWENTKAYSLGFNSVYINVKDREGKGIVDEKDKEKVADEIIKKLEAFTDAETGKKVINKVYKKQDIYTGDYVKDAPDLIIGFNPGYRMSWQTATGGFTKEALNENTKEWKGDHLIDPEFVQGTLISNIKINKKEASQMDVAPTILDALGIEVPNSMDGESLLK